MLGLQDMYLQQTLLRGPLPSELGSLPYLVTVDIRNTLMSCCTSGAAATAAAARGDLLPSFLEFDFDAPPESPAMMDNTWFYPPREEGAAPWELAFAGPLPEPMDDPGANMQ